MIQVTESSIEPILPVSIMVLAKDFRRILDTVAHAVELPKTEPQSSLRDIYQHSALLGIYLHLHGGYLRAVAMSKEQMAIADAEASPSVPGLGFDGVVIPANTLPVIRALCPPAKVGFGPGVIVEFAETGHLFAITTETGKFSAFTIKAPFPDYKRLIPHTNPHRLEIDGGKLAKDIRTFLGPPGKPGQPSPKINLAFRPDNTAILTVLQPDHSDHFLKATLSPGCVKTNNLEYPMDIEFASGPLLRMLQAAGPGIIKVTLNGLSATTWTPQDDPFRQFMLMPVRY